MVTMGSSPPSLSLSLPPPLYLLSALKPFPRLFFPLLLLPPLPPPPPILRTWPYCPPTLPLLLACFPSPEIRNNSSPPTFAPSSLPSFPCSHPLSSPFLYLCLCEFLPVPQAGRLVISAAEASGPVARGCRRKRSRRKQQKQVQRRDVPLMHRRKRRKCKKKRKETHAKVAHLEYNLRCAAP